MNTIGNSDGGARVSLIDLLQELSFSIDWQGDTIAVITKENEQYYLDFEERTLKRLGEDINLLDQSVNRPDSMAKVAYYYFVEKDVVIDYFSAEYLLNDMGTPIFVRSYRDDSKKVYVVQQLPEEERTEYNIVINGKKLKYDDIDVIYESGSDQASVIIPVKRLMEDLGYEVLYPDAQNSVVWVGMARYTISLENEGIMYMGKKLEAGLAGAPIKEYCYVKGNELYMSANSLRGILTNRNIIDYLFDTDDNIVYIFHPN